MRTSLVLVAVAVAAVVYALATPVAAIPGGWKPIPDTNDSHVKEIGAWAVAEHMKTSNCKLTFREVASGEVQVVSGLNYRLVIDVLDLAGEEARYKAVVYEQSWTNTRKLLSFDMVNGTTASCRTRF
ncbi:cysteine proteinase inhibitor 8-like [Phragmites australis]|uniref:cysteine proteinase inhibitor 8-like n=1 Tax=Phragmites australis TaxID=29695 RepID=UPI002D78AE40|nr:cysteine proteinase inhibitor 8-like [Phragmites australis]